MLHARLRVKIKQQLGYTMHLALLLGISRSALGNKLSGKASFKTDEIVKICKILHIKREDVHKYFFEEALWEAVAVDDKTAQTEEVQPDDSNKTAE